MTNGLYREVTVYREHQRCQPGPWRMGSSDKWPSAENAIRLMLLRLATPSWQPWLREIVVAAMTAFSSESSTFDHSNIWPPSWIESSDHQQSWPDVSYSLPVGHLLTVVQTHRLATRDRHFHQSSTLIYDFAMLDATVVSISATDTDFTKDPCVCECISNITVTSVPYTFIPRTKQSMALSATPCYRTWTTMSWWHHRSSRSQSWTLARVGTGTDDMAVTSDVEQTTCYLTQNKERDSLPFGNTIFQLLF